MSADDDKRVLNLSRNHFVRAVGQLVVVGSWIWSEDQDAYEPCLAVMLRYRRTGNKPFVIALSSAYKYDDPVYMAHVVKQLIENFGLTGEVAVAYDMATMIDDHLSDLISMPPNPTSAIIVADGTVGADGQKRNIEIVEYVNKPQA